MKSYILSAGICLLLLSGLIVAEKSVSVTNLVDGSTRLQPVVLQLGQAAGALAALTVTAECEPVQVPVRKVQQAILDAGRYLPPYLDLPASDSRFRAMQRIAATGILRGRGANVGWENQSWFDAEQVVSEAVLRSGLQEVYPLVAESSDSTSVNGVRLAAMLAEALGTAPTAEFHRAGTALLPSYDPERPLTRLECAQLIDAVADPSHRIEVDIEGCYLQGRENTVSAETK